jgi:hypothetical protein
MRDAEGFQSMRGVGHGFPIGRGTHDDADERMFSFGAGFRGHALSSAAGRASGRPRADKFIAQGGDLENGIAAGGEMARR